MHELSDWFITRTDSGFALATGTRPDRRSVRASARGRRLWQRQPADDYDRGSADDDGPRTRFRATRTGGRSRTARGVWRTRSGGGFRSPRTVRLTWPSRTLRRVRRLRSGGRLRRSEWVKELIARQAEKLRGCGTHTPGAFFGTNKPRR
jgi:hypothetical protein